MRLAAFTPHTLALALTLLLAGCASVGPDFVRPEPAAPDDWTSWRSADATLHDTTGLRPDAPEAAWWHAFHDPVLNRLQAQALAASPDLATAALRHASARLQRANVAAQQVPEVSLNASANRQRQSEHGAATRAYDALGERLGSTGLIDSSQLIRALSEPYTLYQTGFDVAWELDLWGRVRRSVEAADADLAEQAALLTLARQSLHADVARQYFSLRSTQQQIRLLREDIAAQQERATLTDARARHGLTSALPQESQQAEQAALQAQLPALLADEGALINQLSLLVDAAPGTLAAELREDTAPTQTSAVALPDLALGLPSEVARQRPDIRAAEARLHRATARIGVARAELYPSIRLGARLGFESYLSGELADWGSRSWSIGPVLSLPLFDRGRRQRTVQLRELEQQQAAIAYHQTVRRAWQEIDDALTGYSAARQQVAALETRAQHSAEALRLAQSRQQHGGSDYLAVLDAQRSHLQARRDLALAQGRLHTSWVAVRKAVGGEIDEIDTP